MRTVLALDLASRSGWALRRDGKGKPRAGLLTMPDLDGDLGKWSLAFFDWMIPFCVLEEVTDVCIEAPFIAQHKKAGEEPCKECGQVKSTINIREVEKLLGLVLFAKSAAAQAAIKLGRPIRAEQHVRSSIVKHYTANGGGKRREMKARVLCECMRRGLNVTSEDIADALAALSFYEWNNKISDDVFAQPAIGGIFSGMPGVRVTEQNTAAAQRVLSSALSFYRKRSAT